MRLDSANVYQVEGSMTELMENSKFANRPARKKTFAMIFAVTVLCGAVLPRSADAQSLPSECGILRPDNQFGPYDYRADRYVLETSYGSHKARLRVVEHAHFTAEVEAGIRGSSGTRAAGDISYTLERFPNHHRALVSLSNIALREKTDLPKDSKYSMQCWFQRAIAFAPDDVIVRLIYASHLVQTKKIEQAEAQAKFAESLAGENAYTHLNLGLVYFDMGNYEASLTQAHLAQSLGLNISTLKELLTKAGKWNEPADEAGKSAEKPTR